MRGYDHCSPCKRVVRNQLLAPYRAENLTNKKKVKENAQDSAYLKEAAESVAESQKKVRLSEQNLQKVKEESERGLSEGRKNEHEPSYDFYEVPSSEESGSDDSISEEEEELPRAPQLGKKRKSPTKTTIINDPEGAPSFPRIPSRAANATNGSKKDLIEFQDQRQPENHFEEVDIMTMDTGTDPTETMSPDSIQCILCNNLMDGTDFGTAGCSHTIHRECFKTRLPTSTACLKCRTPYGVFIPLPGPWRRLRQKN